ncbi:hypothetical protein FRC02_008548 [Tulasnella sp. 418]|nr:hypothetical protein FRC02_008548 [Tulasnella sp. 418]
MSSCSIASTYPEPPTSPSPASFHYPTKFVHGPLRRTYAFYIPRSKPRRTIRPVRAISRARPSETRRSKLIRPTSLRIRYREQVEGDEEAQNEHEETMAPPAKRRKIKD